MTASGMTHQNDYLRKFTEKGFVDKILRKFDGMFDKLNIIDRYLFSGYDEYIEEIKDFKNSLLEFVLESKIHLKVLRDNFEKPRYQQASDQMKLCFIKERLEKINRTTLFNYIGACQRLIRTSLVLHKQYGTTVFKLKYVALNVLGFTAIGAVVGFSLGLALPFLCCIEVAFGAGIGAVMGLGYVAYQFIYKWEEKMKQLEIVRQDLTKMNDALTKVEQQLREAYSKVGEAQEELNQQQVGLSYQEVKDLENYVIASYDEFVKLEQVLTNFRVDGH